MKYKVTRKELNECIAEAVARVIKEGIDWGATDAFINGLMKDKNSPAAQAARQDANISPDDETGEEPIDNSAEEPIDNSAEEPESDEEERNAKSNSAANFTNYYRMDYDSLLELKNNPKNVRELRAINSELKKRKHAYNYLKDNLPVYGYKLDAQGKVQPTHLELGNKNDGAWNGRGADYSGLNHNVGAYTKD